MQSSGPLFGLLNAVKLIHGRQLKKIHSSLSPMCSLSSVCCLLFSIALMQLALNCDQSDTNLILQKANRLLSIGTVVEAWTTSCSITVFSRNLMRSSGTALAAPIIQYRQALKAEISFVFIWATKFVTSKFEVTLKCGAGRDLKNSNWLFRGQLAASMTFISTPPDVKANWTFSFLPSFQYDVKFRSNPRWE